MKSEHRYTQSGSSPHGLPFFHRFTAISPEAMVVLPRGCGFDKTIHLQFGWLQKAKKKGAPNTVQKDGNNKNEESQATLEQPGY